MRLAVLGTGGVGGYFGTRLAAAGEDVVFIARRDHLKAIRTSGLRLESTLGDVLVHPAQVNDSLSNVGPVDVILLGVKTWQVEDAIDAMRPCIGPNTFVVPLQNGVETPDLLVRSLGADHVVGGLCGVFSFISGPGHIRHAGGPAYIKFGELTNDKTDRVERLRVAFEQAHVTVEVPANIQVAQWEKYLFVVPFGGVGAVTRSPLGPLRTLPETRELLEQGLDEVYRVARARGIPLSEDIVPKALSYLDSLTPNATSSMQRDIIAGRQSELES